eukprot:PhM_4_TR16747/c1_g1_i1/m.79462
MYIPAIRFYNLRTARAESQHRLAEELRRDIDNVLQRHRAVLLPVHVRHHWTSAIIRREESTTSTTVYDSAPSPMTKRDILRYFRLLKLQPPKIVCVARQPRESNECGLHVVMFALWLNTYPATLPTTQTSPPTVSLSFWRTRLQAPAPDNNNLIRALFDNTELRSVYNIMVPQSDANSNVNPTTTGGTDADHHCDNSSSSEDEPIINYARNDTRPESFIDVDDPTPQRHITISDMVAAGLNAQHPVITRWAKRTSEALELAQTRDLQSVEDEWDMLTAVQQKARRQEFDRRRQRRSCEMAKIHLHLRTAPQEVRRSDIWPQLVDLAQKLSDDDEKALTDADNTRIYDGAEHGALIDSRIIAAVIGHAPEAPEWLIIPPMELLEMFHGARDAPPLRPHIAAVIYDNRHYTLAVKRASSKAVEWYDSLAGPVAKPPSSSVNTTLAKLKRWLSDHGVETGETRPLPCRRQELNACGIEVLRNIGIQVFGNSNMARDIISRARDSPDERTRSEVWKSAWVAPSTPPTSSNAKVIATRSNDPYAPGVSPHPPTANHTTCSKCGREALAENLCAWHHPRCSRIIKCATKNSNKRPCGEYALSAIHADGKLLVQSNACWYHSTPAERNSIRMALQDPTAVRMNDALTKMRSHNALRHHDVRAVVLTLKSGQLVTVDAVSHGSGPRTTLTGEITGQPTTEFARITWRIRFCARCQGHHTCDSLIEEAIPSSDTTYYEIRAADKRELSVVKHDDVLPECEDLDDGSDLEDEYAGPEHVPPAITEVLTDMTRESPAYASSATRRLAEARNWFVYNTRPPHVPSIVWSQLSDATRSEHRRWLVRLKHADPEIAQLPIAQGAIHLICRLTREKKWRWSTVASKLSAVKSSLANLPLYTNRRDGIDLTHDVFFSAAQGYAQRQARIEATRPLRSRPITHAEFLGLTRELGRLPRTLLVTAWWFAARTGDIRRVKPSNLRIDLQLVDDHGFVPASALFTEGKGARFWGPYTIHTRIPQAEAKAITEIRQEAINRGETHIFPLSAQTALSQAIGKLPDASLRSIRRGSLTWFAQAGVSDDHLQLLSGHVRRDTLLRYLEWGLRSSSAIEAANLRTSQITGGEEPHPTYVGPHAGFSGISGRRTKPPVELFPLSAPSSDDLGIMVGSPDTSNWPLHVKPHVIPMDLATAHCHVVSPDLRDALRKGIDFLVKPELLGATWAPLHPRSLPKTSFTPEHWRTMYAGAKCIPLRLGADSRLTPISEEGPGTPLSIRAMCKGFPTPQHAKQRLRPVFEPMVNKSCVTSHRPPLRYPSRQERRHRIAKMSYVLEFDFEAWYDQAAIGAPTLDHYVCRAQPTSITVGDTQETFSFFLLTRSPMGSNHAAHCMQTVTWAILEPIIHPGGPFRDIVVHTMIDNVLIAGNDADVFVDAITTFLDRCRLFGAQLNDATQLPSKRDAILDAANTKRNDVTFLGEKYILHSVCNSERNVEKLHTPTGRASRQQHCPDNPQHRIADQSRPLDGAH